MILKIKHFVAFITIIGACSCRDSTIGLSKIEGRQLSIDADIADSKEIDSFVAPYRDRVDEVLDSTLAYAPNPISKTDGTYNTTAGNLMADIVLSEANPIYKARTGHEIDFVLLNHGGIRSGISKGSITSRTAYEVMPFENSIVVAELGGKSVLKLVDYLRDSGRAHPISGLQIVLDRDHQVKTVKIQGQDFDEDKTYRVATSNYLLSGGDSMFFFKDATEVVDTDYLIRNAMIDYFKKVDTVAPTVDDRFIKLTEQ
ncbi:5'-nucleotidase C-terminal domain-containing protein [Pseudozobellia thermophila]|uniref:5'-nucleotidase, C-terminal domain n=1 Tax=Pseudozobellia thermophila TaxID=192903 RepID=A0A1M6FAA2_9FLAO|nr:5'-nucleotidase C-terminal domain-containing protein [Pseudozobellia thermophila]SHI94602.1 5'-nucleotidase, C-terminal domain [Pseudozobellia thermophila]